MATATKPLTLAEFEALYSQAKPYYEFWHGEALQKSKPSWIHSLLQSILLRLLHSAGYKTASELKFKIDPDLQLLPDVVATKEPILEPYPTKPVEIVIEILSESDPLSRLLTKCRLYQNWGIGQIYVIDPTTRLIYRWTDHCLEEVDIIANLPATQIWAALDLDLK